MTLLAMIAAAIGLLSAVVYAARRRWFDALLAALAGVALAGALGQFTLPLDAGTALTVSPADPPASLDGVRTLRLDGDGLRGAEWDDLPARPLNWTKPSSPSITVDFPRELALGRMFTLTLHRSWQAPGSLQLLAENGQLLAEAKGDGLLAVQWLPPLAETLTLRARVLDAGGKTVDEGPVPLRVREPLPLQVRGRFGAPSFDLRVLDELLASSSAAIDWQVDLGKGLSRAETARAEIKDPDLEIVDAIWFEHAGEAARASLLTRVAGGKALLVLGANAADAALWSRNLSLGLQPQPAGKVIGGALPMASAALNPNAAQQGAWSGADGIWTRDWQQGRIAWVGVGDWHRHAIAEPRALALWWQAALDRLHVRQRQDLAWLDPDAMPLPRRRLAVCARGERLMGATLAIPALRQILAWQQRADAVDAACVAVWPAQAGWLRMESGDQNGAVYVYEDKDWPLWQRAQRRAATVAYAARLPLAPAPGTRPLPAWPFGAVFALAMLALWWRERR